MLEAGFHDFEKENVKPWMVGKFRWLNLEDFGSLPNCNMDKSKAYEAYYQDI